MSYPNLSALLEAIIYVAREPVQVEEIRRALPEAPADEIERQLAELIERYKSSDRGIEIREIAGGFQFGTKPEHHETLKTFIKNQVPRTRLSLAALETLAVIAYKQPVTLPEIQEIRGVHATSVVKTLLDKKLITIAGRKDVVGRPILYKTTRDFLIHFGLKDLRDLPSIQEFEELIKTAQNDGQAELPLVD